MKDAYFERLAKLGYDAARKRMKALDPEHIVATPDWEWADANVRAIWIAAAEAIVEDC